MLAYEFFMRTRICEYTYTAAAGTSTLAQMERDAAAAASNNITNIHGTAAVAAADSAHDVEG